MTEPTTTAGLDAAWESLAQDIHAHGYSVRDAIRDHRPAIEAEARQQDGSALRLLKELRDAGQRYYVAIARAPANYSEQESKDALSAFFDVQKTVDNALAALPPSTPPGLDWQLLAEAIRSCEDIEVRGPNEHIGPHVRDEYARLEQDR